MNPVRLIAKKRDGGELTSAEIDLLVAGYSRGDIPDYQMSAWAMAVLWRGMTPAEIVALTEAMLNSGARLQWPEYLPRRVDKHSTGGVGDKVSLVLTPMLACCGLAVPMLSGRGLGATGGTLDKLESIPGYRTDLSRDEICSVVERVGCAITGTTADLAPADRRLYALRDVTATVPSVGLITASILSKKLAEDLDALVFDVKFGSGAFMKSIEQAEQLAISLVETARRMGVVATALLTDMEQPLGRCAGNAVEVNEAVAALEGKGPDDLRDLVLALGAELLLAASPRPQRLAAQESTDDEAADRHVADEFHSARLRLQQTIDSGEARLKLAEMAAAHGGDLDAPRRVAPSHEMVAPANGYIASVDTEQLGHAIIAMRGGRTRLEDPIDHSTGLEMLVKLGDQVQQGQPLVRYFAPHALAEHAATALQGAVTVDDRQPTRPLLIRHRIS